MKLSVRERVLSMRMSVRTRILLAQLVPLAPMALLGTVAVLALVRMTVDVHDSRNQSRQIQAMGEAIDLFREEVVLLGRYAETGDSSYAAAARKRSAGVIVRMEVLGAGDSVSKDEVSALLLDYEQLAGLKGPPGDQEAADRAARLALRAMTAEHEEVRSQMRAQLLEVANTGRATAAGTLAVVGVLLLSGLLAAVLVSRSLVRDLNKLARGTTALAAGDFEHRIALDRDDEFGRLARAFNRMAGRIGALDRMKVDFFANISHDLKTPLTSMLEAADLLDEGIAGPLTEEQRQLTKVLKEAAHRLRALVSNVLDVSRLGAQNAELSMGDAIATVDAVLQELGLVAGRKGVTLERTGMQYVPPVLVNRGMVDQVLMNLVGNAIKFSPKSGKVSVSILPANPDELSAPARGAVRISVSDQGPGIPPEYRDKVFQRFFQAPETAQAKGGTGLGLYICHRIVESHGGRIWVGGAKGGGTVVSFTLALSEATEPGTDAAIEAINV